MSEPTVICPACSHVIKLTESLAAPMMAATKAGFERQLAQKDRDILAREAALSARASDLEKAEGAIAASVAAQVNAAREKLSADVAKREVALQEQLKSLDQARVELSDQVDARVKAERGRIAAEEAKKARGPGKQRSRTTHAKEVADLTEVLDERTAKLAEAQQAQADSAQKAACVGRREARVGCYGREEGSGVTRRGAREGENGPRRRFQAAARREGRDHRFHAAED